MQSISVLSWFQTYSWQFIFLLGLIITVGVPFMVLSRRLKAILSQRRLWQDLEKNFGDMTPQSCVYYPNPSRHILLSVLTPEKGVARAGAVGPALDYLAAALDSPLSIIRSLSYLAILVGLLGTVSLLALALQSVDAIGQFRIEQLKNIYPVNAVAIGLAVFIFLSYSWWRHQGDHFLLLVSRVLGELRSEQLGAADPVLLATLEKVGEKFREWGNDIHEGHRQEISRLVQEVQELQASIRQVITAALEVRQEEDRTLIPLLQSQDAKIEGLHQRLYQNYLALTQKIEALGGRPEAASVPIPLDPEGLSLRGSGNRQTGFFSRFFKSRGQ